MCMSLVKHLNDDSKVRANRPLAIQSGDNNKKTDTHATTFKYVHTYIPSLHIYIHIHIYLCICDIHIYLCICVCTLTTEFMNIVTNTVLTK